MSEQDKPHEHHDNADSDETTGPMIFIGVLAVGAFLLVGGADANAEVPVHSEGAAQAEHSQSPSAAQLLKGQMPAEIPAEPPVKKELDMDELAAQAADAAMLEIEAEAAEEVPAEANSLAAAPAIKSPAIQASSANLKAAPVKAAPVKAAPVKAAPVKAAPVKAAPVKAAPVKAAPVKAAPVKAAASTSSAAAQ